MLNNDHDRKKVMRFSILTILAFLGIMLGCHQSSNAVDNAATASFTFFYTNDIMGYVTPCG
ncbi:MAG TPA: hypothetical protein PLP19_07660 [bacterium]|nr:hypothetical protein [bacterium]HPN43348.1 hypothetical protein [bacterium]